MNPGLTRSGATIACRAIANIRLVGSGWVATQLPAFFSSARLRGSKTPESDVGGTLSTIADSQLRDKTAQGLATTA
jgi:hypothetical protein